MVCWYPFFLSLLQGTCHVGRHWDVLSRSLFKEGILTHLWGWQSAGKFYSSAPSRSSCPHLSLCPSWSSQHLVTEGGRGIKSSHFSPSWVNSDGHFLLRNFPPGQSTHYSMTSLCLILLQFPFHRCSSLMIILYPKHSLSSSRGKDSRLKFAFPQPHAAGCGPVTEFLPVEYEWKWCMKLLSYFLKANYLPSSFSFQGGQYRPNAAEQALTLPVRREWQGGGTWFIWQLHGTEASICTGPPTYPRTINSYFVVQLYFGPAG